MKKSWQKVDLNKFGNTHTNSLNADTNNSVFQNIFENTNLFVIFLTTLTLYFTFLTQHSSTEFFGDIFNNLGKILKKC